jgi:hypothetical protein
MGKPARLLDSPRGKPSAIISWPGCRPRAAKAASSASQFSGMAALANSAGAWMVMAAMSWVGWRIHSGRPSGRMVALVTAGTEEAAASVEGAWAARIVTGPGA